MKDSNCKYDVFISYSRRDYVDENKNIIPDNIISQIKETLTKANISYWFDEDGIYSGDAWAEKLAEKIDECSVFLFVSSTNSNKSEWTSKEVATAHFYKKKIVPFRIDDSTYNKSIIIYIANLDYIDYYTNPSLAITRLVDGISQYLKDKREEAEKRLAKRQQEEKEQKRLAEEEQNALIAEIETACVEIDEYELKAEHTRKRATAKVKKVKSADQRTRLTNLIQSSGSISTELHSSNDKNRSLSEENTRLQNEVNSLGSTLDEKDKVIIGLYEECTSLRQVSSRIEQENAALKLELSSAKEVINSSEEKIARLNSVLNRTLKELNTIRRISDTNTLEFSKQNKQLSQRIKLIAIIAVIISVVVGIFCWNFGYREGHIMGYNRGTYDGEIYKEINSEKEVKEEISAVEKY